MYSSYTAASFARMWELAARRKVKLDGALTWAFEFEDQPWFAGYRQLSSNGVDLPVLNVFRMFAQLGADRLAASSDAQLPLDIVMRDGVRGAADVGTIATRTVDGKVAVLVWHYHDDDVPGPSAAVTLALRGLKGKAPAHATVWRVDSDNANAFTAWKKMGAPIAPDDAQYLQLEKASVMQPQPLAMAGAAGGTATATLEVPRQGVALVVIDAE
jgi:xylan 1,4-beta-xylosidase